MTEQHIPVAPHNLDAEQAVIGGLLHGVDNPRAEAVLAMLKPESFYHYAHKLMYQAIQWLAASNQPVDILTLEKRLEETGMKEDLGGFAYLVQVAKNTPSSANIVAYAQIVKDEAVKRFTLAKLQECESLMYAKSQLAAEERLEIVSRLMSEIADHSRVGKTNGLRSARDVSSDWLDDYERYHTQPDSAQGLSSGIPELDALIGPKGIIPQSLAVVGARPKCGKTAFYAMLANQCVLGDKRTALLFSLEMSSKQIFERMASQRARINPMQLYDRKAQDGDENFAKLSQSINELVQSDLLLIDDTPNVSMAHIRNECRRIKRERGSIGLVAVDYLTLMKAEAAERNDLAYGNITKELKNLARELDCVVLLLTQLNRSLESRADKRPMPSDSRDTGQIEQECDYWFGLYKESVYNEDADPYLTEIILRLNRYGQFGKVYCDQRWGSMFPCDQKEAERRAQQGKPEPKQRSYPRGEI